MWVRYRESRNKVTSAIRSTKRRYHVHKAALLMKPDCPSAKWWKAAKELTGQTVDVKIVPPLQDMKGSFVYDKKGKAALLKGEVRRKMNFTCVRVCGVEGRHGGKSLSGQFFFICEKDDREESSMKSLGGITRPKDEMGSQIVSSESDISHPILVYLIRNNNSQAQA